MKVNQHGYDVYRIRAADGSVEAEFVPALGAIVSSLRFLWGGEWREVLFQHPFFWDAQAERTRGGYPFLFPVCGRLERDGVAGAYLQDGVVYQMKIHGFSSRLPWEVEREEPDALTVVLRDSEGTRRQYPFGFEVRLRFALEAGAMKVEQEYANTGTGPMPYYAGFHPYYLMPSGSGKDRTVLRYDATAQLRYNARLTDISGRDAPPPLPSPVTAPEINERLTEVKPGTDVELVYPDGMVLHTLAAGVEDAGMFPYIQLYTMEGSPFFCVEPWMGHPNALNTAKGCRWLAPGQRERGVVKVWTSKA